MTDSFRINCYSALLSLSVIAALLAAFQSSASVLLVVLGCSVAAFVLAQPFLSKRGPDLRNAVILYFSLLGILCVFSVARGDGIPGVAILFAFTYSVLSGYLLSRCPVNVFYFRIAFYIDALLLIYKCFVLNTPPEELFGLGSGNMASAIILALVSLLQFLEYREKHRISILPPIIAVALSVYGLGRAGMLCSLALLLFVVYVSVRSIGNRGTRMVVTVILVLLVSFAIYKTVDLIVESDIYVKFGQKGFSTDGRDRMWDLYFRNLDLPSFILGVSPKEVGLDVFSNNNWHNSYFRIHSQLGVVSFAFLLLMLKRLFFLFRHNFLYFVLFSILLLRGMTDSTYFFEFRDVVIYLFLFSDQENLRDNNNRKIISFL